MLHLYTPWKRFQGVQKCNIGKIWVKRRRVWIPRRLVSWIKRAITESNGINRTNMVQHHCPFLCQKSRSEDKWEVIFITNWYPTFCLTFDLTGVHFRGEFNHKRNSSWCGKIAHQIQRIEKGNGTIRSVFISSTWLLNQNCLWLKVW